MRTGTSLTSAIALATALAAASGCASKTNDDPGVAVSALELPVFDCQTKQVSCLSSAGDLAAAGACNDEMAQCLLDSAQTLLDLARTVVDCQSTARDCVVTGGAQSVASCRQDFLTCVGIDLDAGLGLPPLPGFAGAGAPPLQPPNGQPRPGEGAGHDVRGRPGSGAGFGQPPFAGAGSWPDLGDAGVPLPPLAGAPAPKPGMHGPGLPIADPPAFACVKDLRACVEAGTDPAECASAARECLRSQVGDFPARP